MKKIHRTEWGVGSWDLKFERFAVERENREHVDIELSIEIAKR